MSGGVCIGVDVGGTNLRCALVTADGSVLARHSEPTSLAGGADGFVRHLVEVIRKVAGQAPAGLVVEGVGLGLPGIVSPEGIFECSVHLRPLQGLDLGRLISASTGLPAAALNDANAFALAEQRFGAARGFRSALVVTLGTGVGGGLILDGKPWTGRDGAAGEFGHLTVEAYGISCACGNRGCLTQYASASAIIESMGGGRVAGTASGAAALAELARAGDAVAAAAFERAGRYLGIAAAAVVNLLNLEAIILDGGVAESFDLLAAPMLREVRSRALPVPGRRLAVLKGELGETAGVVGAAAAAFDVVRDASC